MATSVKTTASLSWPAEVAAFAAARGIEGFLPQILEMTQRIFPMAERIEIALEDDPEIGNDLHVVFETEVGLPVAQAVRAEEQWCRELVRVCPSTFMCLFRLNLGLVA